LVFDGDLGFGKARKPRGLLYFRRARIADAQSLGDPGDLGVRVDESIAGRGTEAERTCKSEGRNESRAERRAACRDG
jgi:hypothetical protein